MTRRVDVRTAELVEIALLTRAAFERERGLTFATLAGVPHEVIERILNRPADHFRSNLSASGVPLTSERRKVPR